MNEAISDRSKRVRGFLISWGIFSLVAALFVGIKGLFLVPVIPLVPAALLIKQGAEPFPWWMLIQLVVTTIVIFASIIKFRNILLSYIAHVLLLVYWVLCIGLVGIAIT
jgi:hypothetical protein